MKHLTQGELLDLAEGSGLTAVAFRHVQSCAACREEAADIAAMLDEVRHVDLPEPSPMFWDLLSARVREEIAAEPATPVADPAGWRWTVLAPFAGLALLVLALLATLVPSRDLADTASPRLALDAGADPAWEMIAELVGPLDADTAREAGIVAGPGAADEAVLLMSGAEREELVRLLRDELEQPGG